MHNAARRKVDPPARNMMKMMWSEEAAKNAEKWAAKCLAMPSPPAERTVQGRICGETSLETNYFPTWEKIIGQFSKGSRYFKYGVGSTDTTKNVYGYTQMIWHNSNQVGCATSICPKSANKFYHVCRYCPPGNIVGQLEKPYKEGPSCGDCPDTCEDKLCNRSCEHTDSYAECNLIVERFSCKNPYAEESCPATCKCPKGVI
ncbi:serotriflin-like [Pogona vitticeps]